jgi:hypothetical protein
MHKKKLKSMKPSIDNKPPRVHRHLKRNKKKEQMQEERFAQIERDNRILLSKMSEIMQRNTLDNVNDSMRYAKSLNRESRKKELQRITAENQAILHRIQMAQPMYDHTTWEEEAKLAEKYAENIREYKLHAAAGSGGRGGATSLRSDMGFGGGGHLDPMDEEYARRSRERLAAASEEGDHFPEAGAGGGGRLAPL